MGVRRRLLSIQGMPFIPVSMAGGREDMLK
ncbi:hypothetical protein B0G66_11210 [Bacillus badius]|nr:hypothetical protein B0G66_11210 [Bacillus badius]